MKRLEGRLSVAGRMENGYYEEETAMERIMKNLGKDLSKTVKELVENCKGIVKYTDEQMNDIKIGIKSICILTDELKDKPADFDCQMLLNFVDSASEDMINQFIHEFRKGMSKMDIVEDFVTKFEDPEDDAVETLIIVSKRLYNELGIVVDILSIKDIVENKYKEYKNGTIERREFGNFALYKTFEALSNTTFVNVLFFNELV